MARRRADAEDGAVRTKKAGRQVRVARTPVGLGVFASRRYEFSEIVGEIEGAVIDDADYSSNYCMDLGDDRCLEPAPPFRYVNHSCDPNCQFQYFDIRGDKGEEPRRRVFLITRDSIETGEQLTIDYRWPPQMAIRCRCGAENCRGWIVDETELWRIAT